MKKLQVLTVTGSRIELWKNLYIINHDKFFFYLYTDITIKSILCFLLRNLSPKSRNCFLLSYTYELC